MPSRHSTAATSKIPRFLRPKERAAKEARAANYEAQANSPYMADRGGPATQARLRKASDAIRADIESQTPRPLSPLEKDRFSKRVTELEEIISKDMPSDEQMRRNPTGSTEKHIQWENRHKAHIKEWKARQMALEPDMDQTRADQLLNVERLRRLSHGNSDPNDGATVPGSSTAYMFPPAAGSLGEKAGWPLVQNGAEETLPFDQLLDDSPERLAKEAQEEKEALVAQLEEERQRLQDRAAELMAKERRLQNREKEDADAIARDRRRRASLKRGRDGGQE